MFTTHQKGEIAQLRVQLRATELGMIVSRPTTEARYDLILDDGAQLYRVQVKYAGGKGKGGVANVVTVDGLSRDTRNNGKRRTYSASEVDIVIVYAPAPDVLLWLTPELFEGRTMLCFRIRPAKNGQTQGTRRAEDFVW